MPRTAKKSKPFNHAKPCANCPFLRVGGVRLSQERVEEIAGNMLSFGGGSFHCHKHVRHDNDGEAVVDSDAPHCAGALIFAEKNGNATQMMRIAERLGMYGPAKLMANRKVVESVFNDIEEMLEVNEDA